MLGVPREHADKLVEWTNRTTAFEDPRVAPDVAGHVRGGARAVRVRQRHDRAAPGDADGRPDLGADAGAGGRRAPRARGDPDVLLLAHGGRERQHPGHLLLGSAQPADRLRAADARARASRAARVRRRGVRPLPPRVRVHAPDRDARHRDRGPADHRGRQGAAVVRLQQPRRDRLRGSRPLRRAPQPQQAPGVRRRRAPLLPGRRPCAPGDAAVAGRDAAAVSRTSRSMESPRGSARPSSTSTARSRSRCSADGPPTGARWPRARCAGCRGRAGTRRSSARRTAAAAPARRRCARRARARRRRRRRRRPAPMR